MGGAVNQAVSLQEKVPDLDEKGHEDQGAQMPARPPGKTLIPAGENSSFHQVQDHEGGEKQEEGEEEAAQQQSVDGVGKEKVADVLAEGGLGHAHWGGKKIEQEHFPLFEEGQCDDDGQDEGNGRVDPKRARQEHPHQVLVSFSRPGLGWRRFFPGRFLSVSAEVA